MKEVTINVYDVLEKTIVGEIKMPFDEFSLIRPGDNVCVKYATYVVQRKTFDFDSKTIFLDVKKYIGNVGGY